MSNLQIEALVEWLQNFDETQLTNEDDVETKFVLELFRLLEYSNEHFWGKKPHKLYRLKDVGRNFESDRIYFSVPNRDQQNANTSLVVVEVKRPGEKMRDALRQVQPYADSEKVPFMAITNGFELEIWKRNRHQSDEQIFHATIDQLRNRSKAQELYELINFNRTKSIKEELKNELPYEQYILLKQTLDRYPDILALLNQGHFEPNTSYNARTITATKLRVKIICQLPFVFDEGSCEIKFSSLMLSGLTISLSHREILRDFIKGLNTPLEWVSRWFLQANKDKGYLASLGNTEVYLTVDEADDLCTCIDIICNEYKNALIKVDDILGASSYERVKVDEGIYGVRLASVKRKVWELMVKFAREFDYSKSKPTKWHIFDIANMYKIGISEGHSFHYHGDLWAKPQNALFGSDIDVIYSINSGHLQVIEEIEETWQQQIGAKGIWTADYTYKWLLEQFIPKVLSYYGESYNNNLILGAHNKNIHLLSQVSEIKELASYLNDIQAWFFHNGARKISTQWLSLYYRAFTKLAERAEFSTINIYYITSKLARLKEEEILRKNLIITNQPISQIEFLTCLMRQVERVEKNEYENAGDIDELSTVFKSIVEDGTISYLQQELNQAKESLVPLWQESYFGLKYVINK